VEIIEECKRGLMNNDISAFVEPCDGIFANGE
jgi:hypothetical protein